MNATTGDIRWAYKAPIDTVGGQTSPRQLEFNRVDADNATAFIPVGDTVYARVWHFLVGNGGRSEIWIVALDKLSGRELWRVTVPSYWGGAGLDGAPTVYGSFVIFNEGGHEYAIDARTQHIAWDFPTTPPIPRSQNQSCTAMSSIMTVATTISTRCRPRRARSSGKALYQNTVTRDLLVTDHRVIFPNGMFMEALDRSTGKLLVDAQTPGVNVAVASPASWDAGQVFVNVYGEAWSFAEP